MNKETSSRVSTIAATVLAIKPVPAGAVDFIVFNELLTDAQTLAGSCMSQDETPGQAAPKSQHGIHPAPAGFTEQQLSKNPILHFFHFEHLPPKLRETSQFFFVVAHMIVNTLPRNAERTVALRKLLEAKDAAVRANLPAPGAISEFKTTRVASEDEMGEPREIGDHDEDRDGPIPFNG